MTRTAADAALLLSVISRPDPRDWTALPPERLDLELTHTDQPPCQPPAWACCSTPGAALRSTRRCERSSRRRPRVFASAGAEIVPVAPFMTPELLARLDEFWRVRSLVELETLDAGAQDRVLPFVRRWAEASRDVDGRAADA